MALSLLPLQYEQTTPQLILDAFNHRGARQLRLEEICGTIIEMYSDLGQYEDGLRVVVSRELATQVMSGYVDITNNGSYELQQGQISINDWGTLANKAIEHKAQKSKSSEQIPIPFVAKIPIQSTNYAYYTRPGVPPGRLPSFDWFLALRNEVLPAPSVAVVQEILFAPRPEHCGLAMDFY